jgi:cell division septum initiation protein DivIVA
MAGGLEELINTLYEMVQDAWAIPFGADKCVLEKDKVLDILDEIRATLPSDLKLAKDIVDRRNEVVAAGKRESESIKKQAEDYARQLVNESDIIAEAKKKANDIITTAETKARELRRARQRILRRHAETNRRGRGLALDEVRKSRQEFRNAAKNVK